MLLIYPEFGQKPPDLAWWCTGTMLLCPEVFKSNASDWDSRWSAIVRDKLSLFIKVGKRLCLDLDDSSLFKIPIDCYIRSAARLVRNKLSICIFEFG